MDINAEQLYKASMDSVNLINAGQPADCSSEDWANELERNKAHLKMMLELGSAFFGNLDLTPFEQAVK
jgi:hypothetical protein